MTSRSTWTHSFKHLLNEKPFISQKPARRPLRAPKMKGVAHPRDRIKFWNIQPGDKVGIFRGNYKPGDGKRDQVFEIYDVDKKRNLLEIKDLPVSANITLLLLSLNQLVAYQSKSRSLTVKGPARVHYSNVGLYMGKFPVRVESEGRITEETRK